MSKKIFITGGAQRIGKELVKHFHSIGWDIIFQYRSSKVDAEELTARLNTKRPESCLALQCDFDNQESCKNFYGELSVQAESIHALINNASTFYPKPLSESTKEDWAKLFPSNLYHPLFIARELADSLKKHKGHIINMTDIHAEIGLKNYSIYSAAKGGLLNLTKSLAKELAPDVLVNAIAPGAILWDVNEPSEEKKQQILADIPMKRIGSDKDIVMLADYLITKNTYMTGRNICVDGGKSLS